MKLLSKFIFWIAGWSREGEFPKDLKKCVVIAAPHTSNWDFIFGRAALYLYGVEVKYLIKNSMFVFPLNIFFKATGGIPVDRTKSNSLVDALVSVFENYEELKMIIPPEGTRTKVDKWKTGFYWVAVNAKVPIILGYLDYEKKIAGLGYSFMPTGDKEADFKFIEDFYKDKKGAVPENFNYKIY